MPQIIFASGLRSERARQASFLWPLPGGSVCKRLCGRPGQLFPPPTEGRNCCLRPCLHEGVKILTIFNNRPRRYYGSPEVEGQGAAETLPAQDLLSLYLSLPEEKRKQKFANTSEVARMVGLSRRTIQMWIEVGLITAIKIGRKYQVSLDSLRAYLKSRVDY